MQTQVERISALVGRIRGAETMAELDALYVELIGYSRAEDEPDATMETVRDDLLDWCGEDAFDREIHAGAVGLLRSEWHVKRASHEYPSYIDILLENGNGATVGSFGIEYAANGAESGVTDSAEWRAGGRLALANVTSITSVHGGGNVWADFITLANGLCIVVSTDGISVYASAEIARECDPVALAELNF
jgi:hypothetical protein